MFDLDITSIDGFLFVVSLVGIGLMILLFGGLTVVIGAIIVIAVALVLRILVMRFLNWAQSPKKIGGGGGDLK